MSGLKKAKYVGANADVFGVTEMGATSTPANAAVSVAATSTAVIAAAAATVAKRTTLIENTGDRTVYLAFGEASTTAKYPLPVGRVLKTESLLAINAITASGTGTVFVLAEAS